MHTRYPELSLYQLKRYIPPIPPSSSPTFLPYTQYSSIRSRNMANRTSEYKAQRADGTWDNISMPAGSIFHDASRQPSRHSQRSHAPSPDRQRSPGLFGDPPGSPHPSSILTRNHTPRPISHSRPVSAPNLEQETENYEVLDIPLFPAIHYSTGISLLGHYEDSVGSKDYCRYEIHSASRRHLVKEDPVCLARRDHLSQVFRETYPLEADRLGKTRILSATAYDYFRDIATQLDKTLFACIALLPQDIYRETEGYFVNPKEYRILMSMFKQLGNLWEKRYEKILEFPMVIPRWGPDEKYFKVWTIGVFEMFAVKFREDVETFLARMFDIIPRNRDQDKSEKPSRAEIRRRAQDFDETGSPTQIVNSNRRDELPHISKTRAEIVEDADFKD